MSTPELNEPADMLRDWAASGAVALSGREGGAPVVPPGCAATVVRSGAAHLLGRDAPGLLGERAAFAGLRRAAPWSCGRSFRTLRTVDGHLGLSLPRAEDLATVPALVGRPVEAHDDPWAAVARWARDMTSREAEARVRLLGLAGGRVPHQPPSDRAGVVTRTLGMRRVHDVPLVVDLTALWAGPLCAHLLGLGGARVIKVESESRPDGARRGPQGFFDLLHAGHESLVLDFARQRDELVEVVGRADLVLEASRPRALRQLGLVAEDIVRSGTSWLSITAHGRDSDAIGFGDDVAVTAGLCHRTDGEVWPVGDAIADPLTGVVAALHAREALSSTEARLIDVSMVHVAAESLGITTPGHELRRRGDTWWVHADSGDYVVENPRSDR